MELAVETPVTTDNAPRSSSERTKDASELGATGRAGEASTFQGVPWRGSSDPQESPNYEEAMRKWVVEGGFRSQGLEESHQPVDDSSPPLVTQLQSARSRKQVLEVASEFLVGLLGGAEALVSEGGNAEGGEGHVTDGEGGHVDLGLDQLMQIIPALTELCEADLVADVEIQGLLDETQGVRLLGGVCRALTPVDEAVVWLSELCEISCAEPCPDSDGGLPKSSGRVEEDKRSVPKGSDRGPLPESNLAAGEQAVEKSGPSRVEKEPVLGDVTGGDVATQRSDGAAQGDDLADVAQVQVAVELVRLGVIMLRTAERLVEKRKGTWAALASDESLHATLARFRRHVGELSAAFGTLCKVAGRPNSVLACLIVLCEELGSTGFGVLGDAGGRQTGRSISDAGAIGSGGDGKANGSAEADFGSGGQGTDFPEGPLDEQPTGVSATRGETDGGEMGLVGEGRVLADEETVSNKQKGDLGGNERDRSPAGIERPLDGEGTKPPAESAPPARSGRQRKAPSAWWAVADEETAPAAVGAASEKGRKRGESSSGSLRTTKKSASETVGTERGPSDNARTAEGASGSGPTTEQSPEKCLGTGEECLVEIEGEAGEIDLDEEEIRYDKRSKRRRKVLSYKRRKAQARAPSQNRFVAYAIEEQMLDSESEWDSDQYSDLEDFIALENEDVDFKTMTLSTITPYVPYGDPDEDLDAEAQVPASEGQTLGTA